MSGGGGDNGVVGMLPVAAALAATVMTDGAAAPLLGEAMGAEGVAATMLGSGVIGAGVGGTSALLTGRDPLQGALMGGATGAITSGIGGMMDNSFASGLSSDAAAGIGPGASTTQIGGQEFNQNLYDASSQAADSAGYPGVNNQYTPPGSTPPDSTPSGLGATQPFDAAGYSGAANQVPGTNTGYQQIGANTPQANAPTQLASTNPQNPNAAAAAIKPPVIPDKGLFNTGITGKQALVGLGGLALWNQIQKENKKYGVPTTQASVPSNLNYTYQNHTPMNLSRSYAEGGAVNFNTSPIKQQINANSIGNNGMFPQPGLHSNQYANPVSTPVPANVISAPTDSSVDPYTGQQRMAAGGIAQANLGGYAAGGNPHLLKGPGDGMSDNIPATIGSKQPARLADGEFVVPADVVSHLGNGSTDAGAQKLHSMMDNVRKARTGKKAQGKQIKADKYIPKFADGGQVGQGDLPIINAQLPAQLPSQQVVPAASPALVLPSQAAQTGNPQQNFVNSMYQTNLGRAPEASGNQFWNQQLASNAATPAQVQQGIASSPEAQQYKAMQAITNPTMTDQMATYRNNMLNQYAPTDENFLKQQYLNNLGRAPDQPGMDYWTQQLKNGASLQDVANQFKTSSEAAHVSGIRQAMDSANSPSANMTPGAISSLVSSAYQGNLGRTPDAAGAQYWSEQLSSGKITPQQFVDQLKSSAEFTNKSTGGGGGTQSQQDQFNELMRNYQAQQNQNSAGNAGG